MNAEVPLEGLFLHLVREGFPLGIRDLDDALRALQAGHGGCTRERLLEMCQALWARTEDEHRRLTILFRELLPRPTAAEIGAITGNRSLTEGLSPTPPAEEEAEGPERPRGEAGVAAADFAPADTRGGVSIPKAAVGPTLDAFIVTPKPLVPLRSWIVAWRRFRRALRTGLPVELDIEQTIAEKSRTGILPSQVLVRRRRNQARVVVLVDAGRSMSAWRHSVDALVDSLCESRLGGYRVWYFHENLTRLFRERTLTSPLPLWKAMEEFPDCPAMVVSDAGAVRGGMDAAAIQSMRESLDRFGPVWRPVAWLNPMPSARWRGTSAAAILRLPGVSMLPFTGAGAVAAVDVLRGTRR